MSNTQLTPREEDIRRLVVAGVNYFLIVQSHLGGKNCTKQMKKYVYGTKSSGVHMFNVQKQYEKIQAAARIIAAVPDPSTVIVTIS